MRRQHYTSTCTIDSVVIGTPIHMSEVQFHKQTIIVMCTNCTHLEMCPVVSFLTIMRLTSHKEPYLHCRVLYALYSTDLDFYSVMTKHCRRQRTQLGISLLRGSEFIVEIAKEILWFINIYIYIYIYPVVRKKC